MSQATHSRRASSGAYMGFREQASGYDSGFCPSSRFRVHFKIVGTQILSITTAVRPQLVNSVVYLCGLPLQQINQKINCDWLSLQNSDQRRLQS